jgi:protein AFG1
VDASSAALLRDVLSWYWRLGGVIVSCSVSARVILSA